MSDPNIKKFDDRDYRKAHVPIGDGTVQIEGITVRALLRALQDANPNDVVCYMAEKTPNLVNAEIIIGCIAMVGTQSNCNATFLLGPEGARAAVRRYMKDGK